MEHVISIKIDIRFLVDYNNKEYDVACGEVAKHDGEKKMIDDEGKLCREAKDIVDSLLKKLPFEMSKKLYWLVSSNCRSQLSDIFSSFSKKRLIC